MFKLEDIKQLCWIGMKMRHMRTTSYNISYPSAGTSCSIIRRPEGGNGDVVLTTVAGIGRRLAREQGDEGMACP